MVCVSLVGFVVWSLSARRAWIEIAYGALEGASEIVALRKESVDRNLSMGLDGRFKLWSLSARRAWIEMSIFGLWMGRSHRRSPQGERG